LTPGDLMWTTIALSGPLYALYELSVLAARIIYRRKMRRRDALDAAEHSGAPA
jgi:Sec-independent protein secretion pathway component TatC